MLPSVKNEQTLSILRKLRNRGVPAQQKNMMLNSEGEMNPEEIPEEETVNDIGFEVPGMPATPKKKLQKKPLPPTEY